MKELFLKAGGFDFKNMYSTVSLIQDLPIPESVKIPLMQERDFVGVPCVKIGDKVNEGDVIAKDKDFYFHASISGTIEKISEMPIMTNYGEIITPYIEISFGGKFVHWETYENDYKSLSIEELKKNILNQGIVNLAFKPYLSILDILSQKDIKTLIINGLEAGPKLSLQQSLFYSKKEQIKTAIEIMQRILNPSMTYVVFQYSEKKEHQEFNLETNVKTLYSKNIYPQSHESVLVESLLDKRIRNAQEMLQEGIVILDFNTLFAIYGAILQKKPLISRAIALEGQISVNPGNYFIRIGTLVKDVLENSEIFDTPDKIISGLPINGISYDLEHQPCLKETLSVLTLTETEIKNEKTTDCINCGLCQKHCPKKLIPSLLYYEKKNLSSLKECILCGICEFVCPSKIPLAQEFYKKLKNIKEKDLYEN